MDSYTKEFLSDYLNKMDNQIKKPEDLNPVVMLQIAVITQIRFN